MSDAIRNGNITDMSANQAAYEAKRVTPEKAADAIPDKANLILGMCVAMPPAMMDAIAKKAWAGDFTDLRLYYMHSTLAAYETLLKPGLMSVVHPYPLFMSPFDRALATQGRAQGEEWVHFIPCLFHQAGRLLTENISPDCFVTTVSPMDKAGYFSLGTNPDYGATVARKAAKLIVEVNRNMPRTFGECLLHVNDVDLIVENDVALMEANAGPASDAHKKIAQQIANEIPDGATLQMGIGAVPAVVLGELKDHKDLGLHSELFSPAMVPLIQSGAINGRRKTVMPHKHVFTLAIGDRATYDFMDDNPSMVGYPADWVNSPPVIRKNANMMSVNAAIEVDLTGQVNAEAIGGVPYSGTGGQLDFVRGAYASPGGKSFIAMPSTRGDGTISKFVPELEGGAVTDTRMDAHYVVSEFGLANLKGKSMSERAEALIALSHPNFRGELKDAAKDMRLL
jgi:itaconate CoA-transferase